jgi:methylmalonyl-CoA/ethylmalonyl-CoA epimerase
MRFHHIGLLVRDIAAGQRLVETFYGGVSAGPPIDDPLQSATVQFFGAGGTTIELVAPLGDTSHLHNVLARSGEHLAHLCYEVADLSGEIDRLRAARAVLISRKPAVAFAGREVAFLFLPNRMIIELLSES